MAWCGVAGCMNDNRPMPARMSAFAIWSLVAASLVFWGYRLWAAPTAAPAGVRFVSESLVTRGDLTRLLGAAQVPAGVAQSPLAQASRFRLLGVLAPRQADAGAKPSHAGVALIAIDGKPARAYTVGSRLDGDMVLQSISLRSAAIGPAQGAAVQVLQLPPPSAPATGNLPRAVGDGEPARSIPAAAMAAQVPIQQPHQIQTLPPAQAVVAPSAPPQPQATETPADGDEPANPVRRRGASGR